MNAIVIVRTYSAGVHGGGDGGGGGDGYGG